LQEKNINIENVITEKFKNLISNLHFIYNIKIKVCAKHNLKLCTFPVHITPNLSIVAYLW